MLALLPLIQKLLLDHISRRNDGLGFSLNFCGLGLMALSFILLGITMIFLLLALQAYAEELYGAPLSWLVTAAGTFILASAALLAGHISKRKKGLIHRIKNEVEQDLSPISQFAEDLAGPIKEHPLASVALAALAGLLAGDKLGDKGTD